MDGRIKMKGPTGVRQLPLKRKLQAFAFFRYLDVEKGDVAIVFVLKGEVYGGVNRI